MTGRNAKPAPIVFWVLIAATASLAPLLVGGCADNGAAGTPEPTAPSAEPEPSASPDTVDAGTDGGFVVNLDAGTVFAPTPESRPEPEPTAGPEPTVEPAAEPTDDAGVDAGPSGDAGVDDSGDAGDPQSCLGRCGEGLTCCNNTCIDLDRDPNNCGACGNACSVDEFCVGESPTCETLSFTNICLAKTPYRVDDGEGADIESGTIIADALQAACPAMDPYAVRPQSDATILEEGTGRPVTGVNTVIVLSGGSYFQAAVGYLEAAEDMMVISETTATTERLRHRNGATIVDIPKAAVTPAHDFFVIQIVKESTSGTLALTSYGMFTPGTRAGAYWLATEILPNLEAYSEQYFIYEWTDGDGDEVPTPGDAYDLISSG